MVKVGDKMEFLKCYKKGDTAVMEHIQGEVVIVEEAYYTVFFRHDGSFQAFDINTGKPYDDKS